MPFPARSPSRVLLGQLAVAAALVAVPAHAAPRGQAPRPPSVGDSLPAPAKAEYAAARILFEDHDYGGALVKFQHAFDLSGDARLLWNVAVCEKNLRHYAHVLHLVERYEREAGAALTDADRAEAEELVRTVRSLVTAIRVTADQPGATVLVDDEAVGTTPLPGPVLVDLGTRRIVLKKDGFQPQVVEQDVTGASEVVLALSLRPVVHEGRLTVNAAPGEGIALDGKVVGDGRWEGRVPSGQHLVRVTAAGMRPYESDVVIGDDEVRGIDVTLVQEPHGGGSAAYWIGGGLLVAAGLATGAYFLFRPPGTTTSASAPYSGTISPYLIQAP